MQIKKSTKTWADLPETITPKDYADVIGVGENTARETFNRKDFPRIKGTGVKQLADKEAVMYWVKGINIEATIVNKILQEIKEREVRTNEKENITR